MNKEDFDDRVTAKLKRVNDIVSTPYQITENTYSHSQFLDGVEYVVNCRQYLWMEGHVDKQVAQTIQIEKQIAGDRNFTVVIDADVFTQRRELYDLVVGLIENGADTVKLISGEDGQVHPESVAVVAVAIGGDHDKNIGLMIPNDAHYAKNVTLVENILGEGYVANSNLFNIHDNGTFLSVTKNMSMMPSPNRTAERLGL